MASPWTARQPDKPTWYWLSDPNKGRLCVEFMKVGFVLQERTTQKLPNQFYGCLWAPVHTPEEVEDMKREIARLEQKCVTYEETIKTLNSNDRHPLRCLRSRVG